MDPADTTPIIDVRSPAEYAKGHLPGALSMPLFTDAERAEVGTTYKQVGPEQAFSLGLERVGPKMAGFVKQARQIAPHGRIKVYCWRGGKRSGSMGWLLAQAGFESLVLEGGYKAYRNHLLTTLGQPLKLAVVGGMTGSGKTEILQQLAMAGEQVIDLEGLANHRGSAFGGVGLPAQPSNEQFWNLVFDRFNQLDPNRTIWVEDESRSIGCVTVPEPLFVQMRLAPVYAVSVETALRVEHLQQVYAGHAVEALEASLLKIEKRLGTRHTAQLREALLAGEMAQVTQQLLDYYDKMYRYGLERRTPGQVVEVTLQPAPQRWSEWLQRITPRLMEIRS
ncbi:Rhodanese domain protein [Magnetococcus marinus MC-1]|uniref:Rhodanese domain protein n=1 Tax=Magnetococcus marinus (strain ATCC BAA-1437 / JCM 17883 / MC-1) TaxID=156889 RepID=A0LA93_MAGMM|nr:Rhodanese domain protein [Magnetococcus marinus MC-1]